MDTPKETLGIRHQRAVIPVLSCGKIQCCPMKVKHHTDISIFRSCGTFYLIQTAGLTPCTAGRSSWLQQNHLVRTKREISATWPARGPQNFLFSVGMFPAMHVPLLNHPCHTYTELRSASNKRRCLK